jgi:TPR repeat protein
MADLYLLIQGKQEGPYTEEATRQSLEQGLIPASLPAWREGLPDWKPVSEVLVETEAPIAAAQPSPKGRSAFIPTLAWLSAVGAIAIALGPLSSGRIFLKAEAKHGTLAPPAAIQQHGQPSIRPSVGQPTISATVLPKPSAPPTQASTGTVGRQLPQTPLVSNTIVGIQLPRVLSSPSPAFTNGIDKAFPDQKLFQAAQSGDAKAQCKVGLIYATGAGVTQDFRSARDWYQKAADQGNGAALRHLGNLSRWGQDGHKDLSLAVELYRKAADRGDTDAISFLCAMYDAGEGVPASSVTAMEWYTRLRKLADAGNVRAEMYVGVFNLNGIDDTFDENDKDFAVTLIPGRQYIDPPSVDVGDHVFVAIKLGSDADFDLPHVDGLEFDSKEVGDQMSMSGFTVTRVSTTTFTLTTTRPGNFTIPAFDVRLPGGKIAHEQEMKLLVKEGPPKELVADPNAAFDWLIKSATAGDGEAAFRLSLAYAKPGRSSLPADQNAVQAKDWLHRSADAGFDVAQAQLGINYATGNGETLDYRQAAFWDQKAADQGNDIAETNLGILYSKGDGVPYDSSMVVRLMQKAIAEGNLDAVYLLATMHDDGTAGTKDHALALKWYAKAAAHGDERAKAAMIGPSQSHTWTKDEWRNHVPIQPQQPFGVAGSICTKNALYEAVGMPDRTQTIDGHKMLYWTCADGVVQVVCSEASFANGSINGEINDY